MPTDLSRDTSAQLRHRIAELYELPEYAKQAELDSNYLTGMPSHVFADPKNRTFACVDGPSTWWAAAYVAEQETEYPAATAAAIKNRVKEAADYFQVRADVDAVFDRQQKLAADTLASEPDAAFAVVYEIPEGKRRFFPMRSLAELEKAAEWLVSQRDELEYEDRKQTATRILDRADLLQLQLTSANSHELQKMAGCGIGTVESISEAFKQRARFADSQQQHAYAKELLKTARALEAEPNALREQDQRYDLAKVLDMADRFLHARQFSDNYVRPEDAVFGVTEKLAEELTNTLVKLQNGSVYAQTDLAKLSADQIQQWFGDDVLDSVTSGDKQLVDPCRLVAVAATLPRPDAEIFDDMAATAGITKVATVVPPTPSALTAETAATYKPDDPAVRLSRLAAMLR